MDCQKCLQKCRAVCCGIIPLERKFIKKHKPVRKVLKEVELGGDMVILETEGRYCPYLNQELKCSIYNERLEVCRLFGDESQIALTCPFQDKEGRIRSRQERRAVERKVSKDMDRFLNQYGGKK